ncbi:MAG: CopG family transcriptional regulator [Cyanobacteriota bacterium]|nr:CopG family transcriptional regulator [Cyanobacteriota bacterium]
MSYLPSRLWSRSKGSPPDRGWLMTLAADAQNRYADWQLLLLLALVMSNSWSRFSIRLSEDLKQALIARAEQTGVSLNRLITDVLADYLTQPPLEPTPPIWHDLLRRVEQLEAHWQSGLKQGILPPEIPSAAPSDPSPSYRDPHLWDPVETSFEDWLWRTWHELASPDPPSEGAPPPWGKPISIQEIHRLGFHTMRPQRFLDRLVEVEPELAGLQLMVGESANLGLGDCQPQFLSFWEGIPMLVIPESPESVKPILTVLDCP